MSIWQVRAECKACGYPDGWAVPNILLHVLFDCGVVACLKNPVHPGSVSRILIEISNRREAFNGGYSAPHISHLGALLQFLG